MGKKRLLLLLGVLAVAIGGLKAGQSIVVQNFSVMDLLGPGSTPGNPSAGKGRLYYDKNGKTLVCLNSDGTSCVTGGGGGTPGGSSQDAQFNVSGAFGNANSIQPGAIVAFAGFGAATFKVQSTAINFTATNASAGTSVTFSSVSNQAWNSSAGSIGVDAATGVSLTADTGDVSLNATTGTTGGFAPNIDFEAGSGNGNGFASCDGSGVCGGGFDGTQVFAQNGVSSELQLLANGDLTLQADGTNPYTWLQTNCSSGQTISFNGANPNVMACQTLASAPADTPAVAHNFFTQYVASTGVFSLAQPATTDLSDIATFSLSTSGSIATSKAGAVSAPAVRTTGAPFTGGSGSTTLPLVYLDATGAGTAPSALSVNGTMLGMNAPSGFTGKLFEFFLNGASKVSVDQNGSLAIGSITSSGTVTAAAASRFVANGRSGWGSAADGRVTFNNNAAGANGLTRFTLGTEAAGQPAFGAGNSTILDIIDGAGTATFGNTTLLNANGNKVFVTGNFTTAANTNLQTITGLTFNFPAVAKNWEFTCDLTYSQATGAAAVAFGIQAATNNPTNIYATGIEQITVGPPATVVTGTLATLATTTATNIVSGTPGAQATNYTVHLGGMLELAASANAVNIMVSTATSGDAVTVLRGSSCRLF